ncbi:MAG: sulfotransferase domain-containing protein [Proteobacteria bacterium]|nr:sulfotransferase domain-containing protein [Pseudomonadota bacterium]MBU1738783.1 sulfotransferase domain-containing protein [Pseudomonadota bacterium]
MNLSKYLIRKLAELGVKRRSSSENIYHCCVQKTASQWVRDVLSDARIFKNCGLRTFDYNRNLPAGVKPSIRLTEDRVAISLPPRTIVSPLYLSYEAFKAIPKPQVYKAFFVSRDPRDIVISWYFSMKFSHSTELGATHTHRKKLNSLGISEGLVYCLNAQAEYGVFDALNSWIDAQSDDSKVLLTKYEDLTGPGQICEFKKLLFHLDIEMSEATLRAVLDAHSFKKMSGGRNQGEFDQKSHFRKGISGDWKNYFDSGLSDLLDELSGNVVEKLGYGR